MKFVFDNRSSDSPFVSMVWRTQSEREDEFISAAASTWEMVTTRYQGKISFTVRGPETKASLAPVPADAEFFGIHFKMGTFMPYLPAKLLLNGGLNMPDAARGFWLNGSAWEFPTFENADVFVERLMKQGLVMRDPVIESALMVYPQTTLTARTVQRRFLQTTGLTQSTIRQIERAKLAMSLLEQGVSILDTVEQAGFVDQPHLTKSLKHFVGQTPAQILRESQAAVMSF